MDFNNKTYVSIRLRQAVSHFVRVVAWVWQVMAELRRRVQMESDTNVDGVTERYVVMAWCGAQSFKTLSK